MATSTGFKWDDENKAEVVADYVAAEPTPETSTEIVQGLAEDLGATVNGVRIILQRAEVYIKKATTKPKAETEGKAPRVSKAVSIEALTTLLEANSIDVDEDIVGKMTGKAAVYWTAVISSLTSSED
jgi:hypothetical protein